MSRKIRYYTKVLTVYKAFDYTQTEKKKKIWKQSWLPAFWKKVQNTRDYKTGQNVQNFEEVLIFKLRTT